MTKRLYPVLALWMVLLLAGGLAAGAEGPLGTDAPDLSAPAYGAAVNPYAYAGDWGGSAWYVWGRVYEVTGLPLPGVRTEWSVEGLPGDGSTNAFCGQPLHWWHDNAELAAAGAGFPYSELEPAVHAVIVFANVGSRSPGHLGFVERMEDGRVYFSHAGAGGIPGYSGEDSIAQGDERYGMYAVVGYIYTGGGLPVTDGLGMLHACILQADIQTPAQAPGDVADIYLRTTDAVEWVSLTDAGGRLLSGTETPVTDRDGLREWVLPWQTDPPALSMPPMRPQTATVHAQGTYRTDARVLTLDFASDAAGPDTADAAPPVILAARVRDGKLLLQGGGYIRVTTGGPVASVALVNEFGRTVATADEPVPATEDAGEPGDAGGDPTPAVDADGALIWDLHWQPETGGMQTLQVHAIGADGGKDACRITVNVERLRIFDEQDMPALGGVEHGPARF